jgi:eukaryotic-like serine/threonine-protein kinase
MTRDDAPSRDRGSSLVPPIEEGTPPSQHRFAQDDAPIEPVSDLDIEESLRLLDEIWPSDKSDEEQFPRPFGRFTILGELGRGGFGVVYLAEDPLLGRKVALKLPRVEVLSGTEGWRRFLREARAASRLDHPNLIPLLDAGAIGPVGYIVSAFVPGPSLEQWLRHNRGACSPRWGAQLVRALAQAIEHAHQKNVLHRDLKPGNVMLHATECDRDAPDRRTWENGRPESWTPRICDFGLAKLREIGTDETKSRIGCGSPPYMAPEQAEGRHDDVGPATDVYGLGTILYELLAGRPPFSGASDLEILRKVVVDEPVSPRKHRPESPRDLETICLKCLSKGPGKRYATATELVDELERYLEARPIRARPLPVWARGWRWARRKPALAALATMTLLVVVAGLFGLRQYQVKTRQFSNDLFQLNKNLELEKTAQRERNDEVTYWLTRVHQISVFKQALETGHFETAVRLLDDGVPSGAKARELGFAWSYLRRSILDRLEISLDHHQELSALAVSPDGLKLASADREGAVWLRDLPSGNSRRLSGPWNSDIQHVVFSPDSGLLALANYTLGGIFVLDLRSDRPPRKLATTTTSGSCALLFTRDGTRLTAVRHGPGWNRIPLETYDITATTGELPLANPADCAVVAAELTDDRLQALADMLDGVPPSHLAALDELKRFWIDRPPRGAARTRDKTMVVIGCGEGTFAVYRTAYCLRLMVARVHPRNTTAVIFDAPSEYGGARLLEREHLERLAARLTGDSSGSRRESNVIVRRRVPEPATFSPDGRNLALWDEEAGRLRILDIALGRDNSTFDLTPISGLRTMAFAPDGASLAIGSTDHKLLLWHLNRPHGPQVLRGHSPKEAWSLAFSPDGHMLASGGDDHLVRLLDVQTGRETATLSGYISLVTSVAFAPDGQTLASGSFDLKKPVVLWDMRTRLPKFLLESHAKRVRGVAFSPRGSTLVSISEDQSTMIWDTSKGVRTNTIPQRPGYGTCIAFSPDGRTVACAAGSQSMMLIDVVTGVTRSIAIENEVHSLTFSPDGSRLITGHHDGLIRIWDLGKFAQVQSPLYGHSKIVFGLSLSRDGRTLASGGEDRTVRLWDILSGQELLCLTDCKARVNAVAFSPDGYTLAAADHSGAITLWHAKPRH